MPAERRLDLVVAAICAAVARDHGVDLDLSSGGRVVRGRYVEPPSAVLPCAAVSGVRTSGRRGHALTSWTYACELDVVVWAPAPSADTDARVTRAEQVIDALYYALTGAADSQGNQLRGTPDLQIDASVASDLEGATDHVVVTLRIRWTLNRFGNGVSR